MAPWRWAVVTSLSLAVAGYAAVYYAWAVPVVGATPALELVTPAYASALFTHIAFGVVAIAVGPFQFSLRLRRSRPRLHRAVGRTFLLAVAGGGISALAAAALSGTPVVARLGFAGMACAWLTTAWFAWRAAVQRRFHIHRGWAYRAFAVTLAAVTLRIELPLLILVFGSFDVAYSVVAWLSWVPNLLVAEWILRRKWRLLDPTPSAAPAPASAE